MDMTAAAKDTPAMELKLGRCESTKWTEAKIIMKKVNLIFLQLGHTVLWNFCNEVPPVTMKTMFTAISTTSCWGTTIYRPSFSPKAYWPSSWYLSKRLPGTISCISTICHSVYSVTIHERMSTVTPGPLYKTFWFSSQQTLGIEKRLHSLFIEMLELVTTENLLLQNQLTWS